MPWEAEGDGSVGEKKLWRELRGQKGGEIADVIYEKLIKNHFNKNSPSKDVE